MMRAAYELPASEQLYFNNAPLAHVVAYEDVLRARRLEGLYNFRGGFTSQRSRA